MRLEFFRHRTVLCHAHSTYLSAQSTQRMQYMSVWVYQYMSNSNADFWLWFVFSGRFFVKRDIHRFSKQKSRVRRNLRAKYGVHFFA